MISRSDTRIIQGFGAAFAFLLVAKIVGAAKEVVIAHEYGTSSAVDAYALGFVLANWPVSLGAMCANMLLIPLFVERRHKTGSEVDSLSALTLWALIVSLVVSLVVFGFLRFGGEGLLNLSSPSAMSLAVQAPGIAMMVPSGIIATILAARLMAGQRQIPSLLEAVPSLSLIIVLILFSNSISAELLLGWTTGVGMFAYLLTLLLADRSAVNELWPKQFRLSIPNNSQSRNIALVLVAQIIFSVGGMVMDQVCAASLPNEQNAVVAYANRLLMLGTGLGATAIGRAVLPVLSEAWMQDETVGRHLAWRWAIILLCSGLLAGLVGYFLAPLGVNLLFEHGNFTSADTYAVTSVFRAGLLQFPFYFSSLILAQSVVVMRQFWCLLLANIAGVTSKILVVALFLKTQGVNVIMFGTASMYFVVLFSLVLFHLFGGKRS